MLSLQSGFIYILSKKLKDRNITIKAFFLKCYLTVLYMLSIVQKDCNFYNTIKVTEMSDNR